MARAAGPQDYGDSRGRARTASAHASMNSQRGSTASAMASRAGRSAVYTSGRSSGSSRARVTAQQAMSLSSRLIGPPLRALYSAIRSFTSLQATITACLAVLAAAIAASGLTTLAVLAVFRHYTAVQTSIDRPLQFEYSEPVAVATASLNPLPAVSLLSLITLGTWPLGRGGSSSHVIQDTDIGGYAADYERRQRQRQQELMQRLKQQQQQQQQQAGAAGSAQKGSMGETHGSDGYQPAGGQVSYWSSKHSGKRALEPGQQVSVSVTLHLPPGYGDFFQLRGELLGANGQVLSHSSRTYMPQLQPPVLRLAKQALLAPLYMVGYLKYMDDVKIRLWDSYFEKPTDPITHFRAYLSSRNTTAGVMAPPPTYGAEVHVKLRLGLVRTVLHWLTPSLPVTLLIGMIAGAMVVGGSTAAVICLIITLLLHQLSARARKESATMAAAQEALQAAQAAAAVARRAAAEATAGARRRIAADQRRLGYREPTLLIESTSASYDEEDFQSTSPEDTEHEAGGYHRYHDEDRLSHMSEGDGSGLEHYSDATTMQYEGAATGGGARGRASGGLSTRQRKPPVQEEEETGGSGESEGEPVPVGGTAGRNGSSTGGNPGRPHADAAGVQGSSRASGTLKGPDRGLAEQQGGGARETTAAPERAEGASNTGSRPSSRSDVTAPRSEVQQEAQQAPAVLQAATASEDSPVEESGAARASHESQGDVGAGDGGGGVPPAGSRSSTRYQSADGSEGWEVVSPGGGASVREVGSSDEGGAAASSPDEASQEVKQPLSSSAATRYTSGADTSTAATTTGASSKVAGGESGSGRGMFAALEAAVREERAPAGEDPELSGPVPVTLGEVEGRGGVTTGADTEGGAAVRHRAGHKLQP